MTQSDYKKKRDEAFELSEPDGMGDYSPKQMEASFKAGSDFGREYQRGVEDVAIKNLIGRLHKMFCTGPNIEKEKREVRLALDAYERSKDGVKP